MVKKILFLMTLSFGIILPTMAQNVPSYVPTNGLVGWWPFNGNANDESGNGNNGTVNGATLTADRNGKPNSAYSFKSDSQNINCGKSPNLGLTTNSNLTLSFWTQSLNNKWPYISKYQNNVASNSNYGVGNVNQNFIVTGNGANSYTISMGNTTSWVHLSFVYFGKTDSVKIYMNGNYIQSYYLMFANNISTSDLIFGPRFNPVQVYQIPDGQLDDIAIYNRTLSDQEVKQLYQGCAKETATLNSTNGVVLKNASPITLSASPAGGVFAGEAIANGQFAPAKANLGTNTVNYRFTNSTGCQDTTQFKVMVYDTLGNVCSSTDTLKIKVKLTTGVYSNQTTNLSVYPNPTSDVLIIDASDVKTLSGYSYRILDIQGKEVYKAVVSNAKTEISLKTIGTKGVYILHILDANNTSIENKKIVLE